MRLSKALGALPLILVLAGCGNAVALDGLADGGRGVVTGAVAGDAVSLSDGRTVRLAGIEAPHGDQPYAGEARAALERLAKGREVILLHGGARADPYGRTLAQLRDRKSRKWLQGELLEAGAVRMRSYPDNRALARRMQTAEAKARIARRGLWALPAYQVRLPQEVGQGERAFLLVEGPVARVVRSRASLFLDLGRDLTVEAPMSSEPALLDAGIDVTKLTGRLIRARGYVSDGRLRLDHPEQIELLEAQGR